MTFRNFFEILARKPSPARVSQRVKNYRALPDILNRRAKVELQLWDCFAGRRPLPDQHQCKEWALDLSIPTKLRHPK